MFWRLLMYCLFRSMEDLFFCKHKRIRQKIINFEAKYRFTIQKYGKRKFK